MDKELYSLFKQTINKNHQLKGEVGKWQLSENDVTIKFATSIESFGFSLDKETVKDVFGFFSDSPPKNIAKMCDGIIVLQHQEKNYIFLIEQKTKHPNQYKKQLINGLYFCQWLLSLLEKYKYYEGEVKYIGLLCRNRQSHSKGLSTHQKPQIKSEEDGVKFFETNNYITDLHSYLTVI